jgi:hypothetical protein
MRIATWTTVIVLLVISHGSSQCVVQETQLLAASDGTAIGWPVAMARGEAVAMGPGSGLLYVFRQIGTQWTEVQALGAADGTALSSSLCLREDVLVVGAVTDDDGGTDAGAAYVFRRDQGNLHWYQEQKLTASDVQPGAGFGTSVAYCEGRIAIGAEHDDGFGPNRGAAYVFRYSGSLWVEEQKILPSSSTDFDHGHSVALTEEVLVVGAPSFGFLHPPTVPGAVYLYRRSGTIWSEEQRLQLGSFGDQFGVAVVAEDNCVGIANDTTNPPIRPGAIYLYSHDGTSWVLDQEILASDSENSDGFGGSLAMQGNRMVVGRPFDGPMIEGSAYAFRRRDGVWVETRKLVPSNPVLFLLFGSYVGAFGGYALVGDFSASEAYLVTLDPLRLETNGFSFGPGDLLTLVAEGGLPSQPLALFAGLASAGPSTLILTAAFGQDGLFELSTAVPSDPNLLGLDVELQMFSTSCEGTLEDSRVTISLE